MLLNPPRAGTLTHFVGPIVALLDSDGVDLTRSRYYYDNPLFHDYDLASVPTTWDVEATIEAIPDQARILDLGGGDGRLVFAIEDAGKLAHADVVDVSATALGKCVSEAETREIGHKVHVYCADMFALPAELQDSEYDVVLFGDVVLHYVYTYDSLVEILRLASSMLSGSKGIVVATSFDEEAVKSPAHLHGKSVVVPHRGRDGLVRLFWWAFRFDHEENMLYRTVFVETGRTSNGRLTGVVADLRDRLWRPSQICSAASLAGLRLKWKRLGSVEDGAVAGEATAISVFQKKE